MAMFIKVLTVTVICIAVISARKIPFTNSEQVARESQSSNVNEHGHATTQDEFKPDNHDQEDTQASNIRNEHDTHNETHRKSFRHIDTRAYDNLSIKRGENNPNVQDDQFVRTNSNNNRFNSNKRGETIHVQNERRNMQNKKQTKIDTTEKIHTENRVNENKDKTTSDNEVTPKTDKKNKKSKDQEEDRWIWPNEEVVTTTTAKGVTFEDRASFAGDNCPTGQVKFNNVCVDID